MPGPQFGTPFEILLAWTGETLAVAADETALQVLRAAGVPIDPGCQVGGCGLCATPYVEGDVVHHDHCLNGEDRERVFCPCVSRARSRIVLAL